jgi:hypothetical protein
MDRESAEPEVNVAAPRPLSFRYAEVLRLRKAIELLERKVNRSDQTTKTYRQDMH